MACSNETANGTTDAGRDAGAPGNGAPGDGARGDGARGWYSRGYLPHFDTPTVPQMVTFRLADSLPAVKLARWQAELGALAPPSAKTEVRRRIEYYLDRGHGSAVLKRPDVGGLVQDALLHFDGERYAMHAWVIMPTHVHALLTVAAGYELARIMHSWKSFTASAANRMLGRSGAFWQREYFDRYIRDESHYWDAVAYIEENPVAANLCACSEEWALGSARLRGEGSRGMAGSTAIAGSAGISAGRQEAK